MRILVAFTGGTIGCAPPDKEGMLAVQKAEEPKGYFLISSYDNPYKVEFDTIEPLNILSENMTVSDWNILLKSFKKIDFSTYDGIIITHGTDTMAYTASIFGMLFSGIRIPVIFVGSNYELSDKRADGHQNFADAVSFIKNSKLGGTFVIFKSKVYLSTRINQSKHFTHKYRSPDETAFGVMKAGEFELSCNAQNPGINDFDEICSGAPIIDSIESISGCVLLIRPYVGLNYECLAISEEIKAVLHETYHSSTACVETEEPAYSIMKFFERHKGIIKLYLAPFYGKILKGDNAVKYSSTAGMLNAGIKAVCDMSLESAYAKLLLAYSLYSDENQIEAFLNKPLFFEQIS